MNLTARIGVLGNADIAIRQATREFASNPKLGVASLKTGNDPAPAWSPDVCAKFEARDHPEMITF